MTLEYEYRSPLMLKSMKECIEDYERGKHEFRAEYQCIPPRVDKPAAESRKPTDYLSAFNYGEHGELIRRMEAGLLDLLRINDDAYYQLRVTRDGPFGDKCRLPNHRLFSLLEFGMVKPDSFNPANGRLYYKLTERGIQTAKNGP